MVAYDFKMLWSQRRYLKISESGARDSPEDNVLALHVADSVLIPDILYGPLNAARSNS